MYALIQKSDNQILRTGSEFYELADVKPFYWIECPDGCSPQWTFDGVSFIAPPPPPEPTLEEIKEGKRVELNYIRDAKEISGFTYLGSIFDSDQRSTDRIQVAAISAQAALMSSQPFSIDWTTADNSVVTLDAAGVVGMAVAFGTYGATLHGTAKVLKAQVDAATTVEEVNAVVWPE